MSRSEPTFIGEVQSVSGGVVSIKLRENLGSSLILVDGESYRIGQIGAFFRIPLGYNHLYAICTQVGAAAAPVNTLLEAEGNNNRWISVTLFGEALGGHFERGVSQYPTVGDEVHLVTVDDLKTIYGSIENTASISVGNIAASSGIVAKLDLGKIVTRHCAIVGSTGSGKSNLTAVLLEAISQQGFPAARVLVIDPHGEYGSTIQNNGYVFKISPDEGESPLYVPFWALPFDELMGVTLGEMSPNNVTSVRDEITARKRESAKVLSNPLEADLISADSPIPFNLKKLWFDFDDYERVTLKDKTPTKEDLIEIGDFNTLKSNIYPPHSTTNNAPFQGPRRNISRALEILKSRLRDSSFDFLFSPGPDYSPDEDGKTLKDLDALVATWVGHDRPITVLDVSGLPSEITSTIVGTLLRIVYDTLFWSGKLPISGKKQPLLMVLEEAHLFLPEGSETAAHRTITKIAKEGRKYGVGLLIVTQRPSEIDSTSLSQCGTMIALRMNNGADRTKVSSAMPDDLGNLAAMLPSLRTGEGLVIGEAMPIPSRILFNRAKNKPIGGDPDLAATWKVTDRPDPKFYTEAVENWRTQSTKTKT
ncbi:MAG TPA: ATP-binding protein [Methylophilaceae bacterium]|jgi:hypothetical protein